MGRLVASSSLNTLSGAVESNFGGPILSRRCNTISLRLIGVKGASLYAASILLSGGAPW